MMYFWVVEKYINNTLNYWTPLQRQWTPEIDLAARFFDDATACMVLANTCQGEGRTAAHQFIPIIDRLNTKD